MATPPQTPSKRTKPYTPTVILSPYFSRTCVGSLTTFAPQRTDSEEDLSDDTDTDLYLRDPLFCYYYRAFLLLFRQLALLKPVLIQERVADDPWKLLIAVTLLNKTSGRLAIPIFWAIIAKWTTPWALSQADSNELTATIQSLGTQNIRSRRLISLSKTYLNDPPRIPDLRPSTPRVLSSDSIPSSPSKRERYPPTPISHLPGAGKYALDSYRIFCTVGHFSTSEEWKTVIPTDKELIRYLRWKWAFMERKEWVPGIGTVRPVTLVYLKKLISDLNMQ